MISDERLTDFCRALVSTVRSGLPLSEAFESLARSGRYGSVVTRAYELASGGAALHEAFGAQKAFPPVFIALLRAGEESGKTDEFLELYADCLDVRVRFRRRLERMLVYPAFAVILAGALFLLVSFKVVPMVLEPLLKAGAALPPRALAVTRFAGILYRNWPPLTLFVLALLLAGRMFIRSGPGRKLGSIAGHWLPGFRFASEEGRFYYLYTTMGLLLRAGLPLGTMMDVLLQFSQDDPIDHWRLSRASGMLYKGTGFSASLAPLLPKEDRYSVEIAEKAGRLDDTLIARGKLHYDRHLHRLKLLVKIFNISLMVWLAAVCFGLLFAIAWPVLSVLGGASGALDGPAPAERPGVSGPRTPSRTELFNKAQGGRIADFIKTYSAKGAETADDGRSAAIPRMKTSQFQTTGPSDIRPTDIRPAGIHSR